MENSFVHKVRNTTLTVFRYFMIALFVIGIGVFSIAYWGVYERGVMAGKILRISKKGMIFKTYEGKINLETFGALRDASPIAESFDFSVETSDIDVIAKLEEVSLSGERVNLHFVKRHVAFPWRGDTRYFATRVERAESQSAE